MNRAIILLVVLAGLAAFGLAGCGAKSSITHTTYAEDGETVKAVTKAKAEEGAVVKVDPAGNITVDASGTESLEALAEAAIALTKKIESEVD